MAGFRRAGAGTDPRAALRDAASKGLAKGLEQVKDTAVAGAPVADGDLRDSAEVRVDGLTGEVVFNVRHASIQHERMDYNHPGGGGPKFLEQALASERDVVRDAIAESIQSRLTK